MRVMVENIMGRFHGVDVGEKATVGDLRRRVAELEAIEEVRVVLMEARTRRLLLREEEMLASSGLRDGALIYLFIASLRSSWWPFGYEDYITIPSGGLGKGRPSSS